MAGRTSSAEPEKLFRYSDFGTRLDHELISESYRLTARLQRFTDTCTEPGYQVRVGHLGDTLHGYGRQNEETDSWVRRVGHGFQMADWGWMGARTLSGVFGAAERFLPGPTLGAAWGTAALLPLLPIPDWLERIVSSVPWFKYYDMTTLSGQLIPESYEVTTNKATAHTTYSSSVKASHSEIPLPKQAQDLQAQIEGIQRQKQRLLELRQQLVTERDRWQNRIIPDLPFKWGYYDGLLDVPWHTMSDRIEDQIFNIDRHISKLDDRQTLLQQEIDAIQKRFLQLQVPFVSQWDFKLQQGCANCGPASLAMTINKYGGSIKVDEVASTIRKGTGHTDFKSEAAKGLLDKNGLKEEDVKDLETLQNHLDQEHPVIMLVDNSQYLREENGHWVPYPNTSGFKDDHIVVVTGYERDTEGKIQYVSINDPLAIKLKDGKYVADPGNGTSFRVPIKDFEKAVTNEGWYGAAILPK